MGWVSQSILSKLVIVYHKVSGRMSNFDKFLMSIQLINIFAKYIWMMCVTLIVARILITKDGSEKEFICNFQNVSTVYACK